MGRPLWNVAPRRILHSLLGWPIKLAVFAVILGLAHKRMFLAIIALTCLTGWWILSGGTQPSSSSFALRPMPDTAATLFARFSSSASSMSPAAAAEQYLRGQSRYDARMMWDAVSDEMKRTTTARGNGMTLQRLEQQLEEAQRNGQRYDEASYVGGYVAPDGRGFYLYVVGVSTSGNTNYIPYTFTIGPEDKILSID